MSSPSLEPAEIVTSSDLAGLRSVAVCQLKGFSEDFVTRRAFEWRYRWLMLSAVPMAVVAIGILAHREGPLARFAEGMLPQLGWDLLGIICLGIVFVSMGLFFGAMIHAINGVPVSRISGHRMMRFEREDAPLGSELIYVDPTSRTYFCRVVRTRA